MARPTLPPLPAASLFSKPRLFPRKLYPQAADPMARTMPGRQIIASSDLADELVRALDVQEGEVVIECFPGHGQVTRSLLRGGRSVGVEEEWADWERWSAELSRIGRAGEGVEGSGSGGGKDKGKGKAKEVFPWTEEDLDLATAPSASNTAQASSSNGCGPDSTRQYRSPRKVIAVEPSHPLLTRALGQADEMALLNVLAPSKPLSYAAHSSHIAFGYNNASNSSAAPDASVDGDADRNRQHEAEVALNQRYFPKGEAKIPINESIHHPDLILTNSSAYAWNTLPYVLSHPLVAPHIDKRAWTDTVASSSSSSSSSSAGAAVHAAERPDQSQVERVPIASPQARAEAAHPPFTILAHIPDSVGGEQLVSQWIGSVTGSEQEQVQTGGGSHGGHGDRQWIWGWGRARLALLVNKTLYDRLMAKPGEAANSRLSILTSALFHRSTLPPYHHVANVDRNSGRTTDTPIGFSAASIRLKGKSKAKGSEQAEVVGAEGTAKRRRSSAKSKAAAPKAAHADAEAEFAGSADSDPDSTSSNADATTPQYAYKHRPSLYSPYLLPTPPPTPVKDKDFYPPAARATPSLYLPDAPTLARPHFLGIQLVPRVHSPVTSEQKDVWDYVLRNCFVLQGKPLEEAIGLLGFAAEGLLGKIEEQQVQMQEGGAKEKDLGGGESVEGEGKQGEEQRKKKKRRPWRGEAVDRSTLVRDLTVEQWARVVDVFDRWAFRPKNLLIDAGSSEEVHREIAVD